MVNFPAPVGGTVLPEDFAPSVLFAVLYGLLVPLMAYRMLDRRSRSTVLLGTIAFSIERIVIFSLRAVSAHSEKRRFSTGLVTYLQVSFALGYIGLASDLITIVRCLLVNPTYGPERFPESAAAASNGGEMTAPTEDTHDMADERRRVRAFTAFGGLPYLGATIPGIIATSTYTKALSDQSVADRVFFQRIVSSVLVLPLNAIVFASVIWGIAKLPRINRKGAFVICLILTYLSIISVYRLSVMSTKTSSLSDPNRLNLPAGKATFYIFHVLPEWLTSATLFGFNIRKIFGTGPTGDWRVKDETEDQKRKRLAKTEMKLAKQEAKKNGTGKVGKDIALVSLGDQKEKKGSSPLVYDP